MALHGHVFNKQLFSSECFALFIDTFLARNSGIVNGCELSNTADSITIGSGYLCIQGRFLEEQGGTTFEIESATENDFYCKLICEIDLSKENTTSELKQAYYKILKSTNDYPELQQEDITVEDSIYQFEFAQFKVTENGIEDFLDKRLFLDFPSIYAEIRRSIKQLLESLESKGKIDIDALVLDLKKYCDTAKNTLEGDVALNLLNLIMKKSDIPTSRTLTLAIVGWVLNETTGYYEYDVVDESITENDYILVDVLNKEQEEAMTNTKVDTGNGSIKFTSEEQIDTDVELQLVIMRTKEVEA